MTFEKCSKIRQDNFHLIDSEIIRDEIQYRVEDIVIFPPKSELLFLSVYNSGRNSGRNKEEAENRFMTMEDLEVYLFCTNLSTNKNAILSLEE
jgi:hypothetical protein